MNVENSVKKYQNCCDSCLRGGKKDDHVKDRVKRDLRD